jgi:hypothetical protein
MRNLVINKPTADEMATAGPIANKPPAIAARHRAVVLRNTWRHVDTSWDQWAQQLAEVEKERIWEIYPDEQSPCGSLEALLATLGIDPDQALHRDKYEKRSVSVANAAKTVQPNGVHSSPDNYQGTMYGTSEDYLAGRIARDRPDILEDMKQGKYRSVRAAAIEAGIVKAKPRFSVSDDPEAAGKYFAGRVDREWMEAMLDAFYSNIGD